MLPAVFPGNRQVKWIFAIEAGDFLDLLNHFIRQKTLTNFTNKGLRKLRKMV